MAIAASNITAFTIIGGLTALWAVVLAAIGITRHGFPGKESGARVVMGISVLLVVASIAAAIGSAKNEPKGSGKAVAAAASGAAAPAPSGTSTQPAAPAPSGGGASLTLTADPTGQLKFDKTALQAKAGAVTIVMRNPAPLAHNISLEGNGVNLHGATVSTGKTSTVKSTLKPGTYTFYCSVPGHRQAGMQGTLTVK